MDLNTITEIVRPRRRAELPALASGRCVACRRDVVVFRTAAIAHEVDRHRRLWLAGFANHRARLADRRDLQNRGAGWDNVSVQLDGHAAVQSMLPVVPRLIQNLEHGDGRRQSLHGVAGGADDCADRGIGWHVHDLDAGRRRTVALPSPILYWGRNAAHSCRASCFAPSRCRFRRCANVRPFGKSRSPRLAARPRLLIGTLSPDDDTFAVTVTASTPRPIRLSFPRPPTRDALRERVEAEIQHYYDDVHGAPAWRRHMTLQFAEEIRQELAGEGLE